MGPIGCPETSVQNYHSKVCNIPEERKSQSDTDLFILFFVCLFVGYAFVWQLIITYRLTASFIAKQHDTLPAEFIWWIAVILTSKSGSFCTILNRLMFVSRWQCALCKVISDL
jgi:hypothetical protein